MTYNQSPFNRSSFGPSGTRFAAGLDWSRFDGRRFDGPWPSTAAPVSGGAGAVTLGVMAAAGTAAFAAPATGAVALAGWSAGGIAILETSSLGSITLGVMAAVGTAAFAAPATGAVTLAGWSAAGAGTSTVERFVYAHQPDPFADLAAYGAIDPFAAISRTKDS